MSLSFEWDEDKYFRNYLKHRIRFEDATLIWSDEHSLEYFDEYHSKIEARFIRIGRHPHKGILLVVFCERGETKVRIISARLATKLEIQIYER